LGPPNRRWALFGCPTALVLHRQAPQPRQHPAFLFRPDSSEGQARTNRRNLLHRRRRALPDVDAFLQVNGQTLGWHRSAPVTSDVAGFENAFLNGL
jgi:DNA-binding SARP family transcriptional activator